jgi:hypothetical protein
MVELEGTHLRLAKGEEGSVHLLCASADLSQSYVHLYTLALHRRTCTFESKVANSHAWSCEEAELASLGWICDAE